MHMRRTNTVTAAVLAALGLVTLSRPDLGAQRPTQGPAQAPPLWDTFRADLTIRQTTVVAAGEPAGPAAPALTVRMERRQAGARWRTTMTLAQIERPQIRGLATSAAVINPFEVARMEYDEDGTPPRMYDRQGRLVRLPGAADRLRLHTPAALAAGMPVLEPLSVPGGPPLPLTGHAWIDEVMAPLEKRQIRRANIERQLGRPSGQVRGLDRFVAWLGEDTHEVLVDPQTAVPVEVNTSRQGNLVARTTMTLVRDAAGRLRSRSMRTERSLPGDGNERRVTDVELANIQLTKEGAR